MGLHRRNSLSFGESTMRENSGSTLTLNLPLTVFRDLEVSAAASPMPARCGTTRS